MVNFGTFAPGRQTALRMSKSEVHEVATQAVGALQSLVARDYLNLSAMSLKRLRRSIIALWLGVITLAVSGIEQNQLARDVMQAAVTDARGPCRRSRPSRQLPDARRSRPYAQRPCRLRPLRQSRGLDGHYASGQSLFPRTAGTYGSLPRIEVQPASLPGLCPSSYSSRAPPAVI